MVKFLLGIIAGILLVLIYISTIEIPEFIIQYECTDVNDRFPPLRPKNSI